MFDENEFLKSSNLTKGQRAFFKTLFTIPDGRNSFRFFILMLKKDEYLFLATQDYRDYRNFGSLLNLFNTIIATNYPKTTSFINHKLYEIRGLI